MKKLFWFGITLFLALASVPATFAQGLTEQGKSTATETTSGLSSFLSTLWAKAPSWIAAMIVFAFAFIFAKVIKEKVIDQVSEKFGEEDADVLTLIGRATYAVVLAIGITIALKIGGIDLTAIMAAVGFGLGFAMQDLIMNFFAGILILVNRQFTIGDFIKINDTVGKVEEIQSRATILKALDGTRIIVPNADLFKNQVVSFTSNPFRRIEVAVGVDYRTDLGHASRVILEALRDHPQVVTEPKPAIVLDQFADSSINFFVRFWVDSHSNWVQTKSEVIHLIKQHFDKEGIGIPFPIRTLVFDKDTEDVVMPTYQVPAQDVQVKKDQRTREEADLAAMVAASSERVNMEDIQPTQPLPVAVDPSTGAPTDEELAGSAIFASAPASEAEPAAGPAAEPLVAPAEPAASVENAGAVLETAPVDVTAAEPAAVADANAAGPEEDVAAVAQATQAVTQGDAKIDDSSDGASFLDHAQPAEAPHPEGEPVPVQVNG